MKKLIIANWKMNPKSFKEAEKLVLAISKTKATQHVVICQPFVYLSLLKTKLELGAQDMFWQNNGAFTGQVSAEMLKQFKVKYAIIGHSERRALGETDNEVNLKVKAALANKITPVLCVGYGLSHDMADEEVMQHLQNQLEAALYAVDPKKVIVAYEPVWAISTGDPYKTKNIENPDHAERICMFVRIKFKVAKVLYGGSSNALNAQSFLERQIDGLLVGGASLKAEEFNQIITIKI